MVVHPMLFLPESVYEARRSLLVAMEKGEIPREEGCRKILRLEPEDYIALTWLAMERKGAGDPVDAEVCLWQSIQANPCQSLAYRELGRLYKDQPGTARLAEALSELAILRMDLGEGGILDELPLEQIGRGKERKLLKELRTLPEELQAELVSRSMRDMRADEPPEVTERLRYLRLAQQAEQFDLERVDVDAILAAGEPMVPLLRAMARAWAQQQLPETVDEDCVIRNSIALLAELAQPDILPELLELIDLEDPTASGVADWAIGRLLDRNFAGTVASLEPLAASLGIPQRFCLLGHIQKRALMPGALAANSMLATGLESLKSERRGQFMATFVVSSAAMLGKPGLAEAKAIYSENRKLFSANARGDIDYVLRMVSEGDLPPGPMQNEPPDVYEICQGLVDWQQVQDEVDGDSEENDDDDQDNPPKPRIRQPKPGRNDPCWCGSRRKYKKCHLNEDEEKGSSSSPISAHTSVPDQYDRLRQRVGEFLYRRFPQADLRKAARKFLGPAPDEDSEIDLIVSDWLVHDWQPQGLGHPVVQEFLIRNRSTLKADEQELLEAWAASYVCLYEVEQVKRGVGVTLKNLLQGGAAFVHDISISETIARWDHCLLRVAPGERGLEITGGGVSIPPAIREPFLDWLRAERKSQRLEWPEYLKRNWPGIRLKVFEMSAGWRKSVQLANTDGDPLLFSKAFYDVVKGSPFEALRACPEFEEDNLGEKLVWLNEKKTVLGSLTLEGNRLIVDCNSKQRLTRARALVEEFAGGMLRHSGDAFTTLDEQRNQPAAEPEPDPIPDDVRRDIESEFLRRHYSAWPDEKLPALNGKTPRQAMKTLAGKRKVVELLKTIENAEERKRLQGRGYYNTSELRTALGLD